MLEKIFTYWNISGTRAGRKATILNMVVRVGFFEKVTIRQGSEAGEGITLQVSKKKYSKPVTENALRPEKSKAVSAAGTVKRVEQGRESKRTW